MSKFLDQWHLECAISDLEKGYVASKIELIKAPIFRKAIEKDIADKATSKEKKAELEKAIESNKLNEKGYTESIENLELILTEVYKLRK